MSFRSIKMSVGERSAVSKNDSKRGSSYPSFFIPGKWYPRLAETCVVSSFPLLPVFLSKYFP